MISFEKDGSEWFLEKCVNQLLPFLYVLHKEPSASSHRLCYLLCLLLKFSFSGVVQESLGSDSSSLSMADVFHGPYPYVGITAPRQMAPICLRVPSKSRKGAVVVCSHPVMVYEIKSPSPSYTESCHHRSTKYGHEIAPQNE